MNRQRGRNRFNDSTNQRCDGLSLLHFFLFPIPLGRFDDDAFFQRTRRDADVADFTVDDGLDALEVRKEAPLGDGGYVRADAALFLRLAAAPDDAALHGTFAGQFTDSCHKILFKERRK